MADEKKPKRAHKATYATDKHKGGYLVRVQGPHANMFVNREVPVTRKNGEESMEKLTRLIWTGLDTDSGQPCALYAFEPKAKNNSASDVAF